MDNAKKQEEIARQQSTIQQQDDQIADVRQELVQHENNTTSVQAVLKQQLKQKEDEINTLKETKAVEKRKRKEAEKEKDRATAQIETTKKTWNKRTKNSRSQIKAYQNQRRERRHSNEARRDRTNQRPPHQTIHQQKRNLLN